MERLDLTFFEQSTVKVARQLLGCILIRKIGSKWMAVKLTETEAYLGGDDPASHAFRGPTPRNEPMFGKPGRLYVYLSYGIHSCMNVVTESEGTPGAVLLRGAEPVSGLEWLRDNRPNVEERQLLNGPGKLAQGLAIGLDFNQYDLCNAADHRLSLWRESCGEQPGIACTGRIGVSRAQERLWRFLIP